MHTHEKDAPQLALTKVRATLVVLQTVALAPDSQETPRVAVPGERSFAAAWKSAKALIAGLSRETRAPGSQTDPGSSKIGCRIPAPRDSNKMWR
jgi:hypothetical protein